VLLLSQQGGALAGAGWSQVEGLLLLCSGGGCLLQATLPEGNKIWEKDLMIFSFYLFLLKSCFKKSFKLHEGSFCWVIPDVCQRVWLSFKRGTVLGGMGEERCLGWWMEGRERRTGGSSRADRVVC